MPKYGVETALAPEEAIAAAIAYFGGDGLGLDVESRGECCTYFEGGGGFVRVAVTDEGPTQILLETREWDYHVKKFMAQVATRRG